MSSSLPARRPWILAGLLLAALFILPWAVSRLPVQSTAFQGERGEVVQGSETSFSSVGHEVNGLERTRVDPSVSRVLVCRGLSGAPLASVGVGLLTVDGVHLVHADQEGMVGLPPGDCFLYVDERQGLARQMAFVGSMETGPIEISLHAAGSLVVTVLDGRGNPVAGLPVQVAVDLYDEDARDFRPRGAGEAYGAIERRWRTFLDKLMAAVGEEVRPTTEDHLEALIGRWDDLDVATRQGFLASWRAVMRGRRWVGYPYAGPPGGRSSSSQGVVVWRGLPAGREARFYCAPDVPMLPDPYPWSSIGVERYPISRDDERVVVNFSAPIGLQEGREAHGRIHLLGGSEVRARLPSSFPADGTTTAHATLAGIGRYKAARALRLEGEVFTKWDREIIFRDVMPGWKTLVASYSASTGEVHFVGKRFEVDPGESLDLGELSPWGEGAITLTVMPIDAATGTRISQGDGRVPLDYWSLDFLIQLHSLLDDEDDVSVDFPVLVPAGTPVRLVGLPIARWRAVLAEERLPEGRSPSASLRLVHHRPRPSVTFDLREDRDLAIELPVELDGIGAREVRLTFLAEGDAGWARHYRVFLWQEGRPVRPALGSHPLRDGKLEVLCPLLPGEVVACVVPGPGEGGGFFVGTIYIPEEGEPAPVGLREGVTVEGRFVPVGRDTLPTWRSGGGSTLAAIRDPLLPEPSTADASTATIQVLFDPSGRFRLMGLPPGAELVGIRPLVFDFVVPEEDSHDMMIPVRLYKHE